MTIFSKQTFATLSALLFLLHAPYLHAQQPQAESPAALTLKVQVSILQNQLDGLQQELAVLRLTYSDNHPKIQAVLAQINSVTQQLATHKALAEAKAAATANAISEADTAKLNQEITDLQARKADMEKAGVTPPWDEVPTLQDRIDALQAVLQSANASDGQPLRGLFQFNGGHPLDLIRAAGKQFHLPWLGIVTLPKTQSSIQIPPFTLFVQEPAEILKMYGRMAENNPSLGQWDLQGDIIYPDALILDVPQPDPSRTPGGEMKVRAFSVAWIAPEKWGNLKSAIDDARVQGLEFMQQRGEIASAKALDGTITGINEDAKVMVVIGSQSYIDMVSSILCAYQGNPAAQVNPTPAPASAPATSGTAP